MTAPVQMLARPTLARGGPAVLHSQDATRQIAALAENFSLEVTRPRGADLDDLTHLLPAGTAVYLSALPGKPLRENLAAAKRLRESGLEPVLHVAVRNYANAAELDATLAAFAGEAGLNRVLVIAGDRDKPEGELRCAREAIDSGVFNRHGIVEIGIAGYPEGHPRLAPHDLERALIAKLEAVAQTGLTARIVTQFAFDAAPIIEWLARLRAFGIEVPVRIGLAGPTSMTTLLRYAQRCGVKTSAQALARQTGLMRQVFSMTTPDSIVRPLAAARSEGRLGEVSLHLFSFGGAAAAARWASAVARGKFTLEPGGGFRLST